MQEASTEKRRRVLWLKMKIKKCKVITGYGTRCQNNAVIKGLCMNHYFKKNRKKTKNGQTNKVKV